MCQRGSQIEMFTDIELTLNKVYSILNVYIGSWDRSSTWNYRSYTDPVSSYYLLPMGLLKKIKERERERDGKER